MKLSALKIQGSIFTAGAIIGDLKALEETIKNESGSIFQQHEVGAAMAVGPHNPEVPYLLIGTPDKSWQIHFSIPRINIFWHQDSNISRKEPALTEFSALCSKIFVALMKQYKFRTSRLAIVTERASFDKGDQWPQWLCERLLNSEVQKKHFSGAIALEIHRHELRSLGNNLDVNTWLRLKTPRIQREDKAKILLIEADVNTVPPEQERWFSTEEVSRFFVTSPEMVEKLILEFTA